MRFPGLTIMCGGAILLAGCGDADQSGNAVEPAANESASAGSGPVEQAPAVPLAGADGRILGEVRAGDSPQGAVFHISAQALPPGTHGLHIHDVGLCEGPKFETAGGHWNPEGKQHGLHNPQGPHRGDLPNVTVGEDGRLSATVTVEASNLRGSRAYGFANQIIDENGAALVIHAGPDDMRTDPSGNSGDRIACAVLGAASMPPG
jgi:Cu-Zn family superoxide dismutase